MIEIVSSLIAAISVVVAIVFGVKNHGLGQRNEELQHRLLKLEESREAKRMRESTKANIVADIKRGEGSGPRWQLQVENKGQSEARDITVLLDAQPILDHPAVVRATRQGLNSELEHLASGSCFRFVLAPHQQSKPPWLLHITWTDDSGEPGNYEHTLTW